MFICYLIITNLTCFPVSYATHTTVMQCVLLKQSSFILWTYLHPVFCEWIRHKNGKICKAIYLQNLDNHHSNKLLERIQVRWDVTLCWRGYNESSKCVEPLTQRHGVTFQSLELLTASCKIVFGAQWSLYVPHIGHYIYRTVVTTCTARSSLHVPPV
jgi:hypothetical protein